MTAAPDFEAENDPIPSLLRSAGRRPAPPRETTEAVYLGALLAWRRAVRRRRWRFTLAAAAAVACVGIGAAWLAVTMRGPAAPVAAVASAIGCAGVDVGSGLMASTPLDIGADCSLTLETPEHRVLRLAGPARAQFADGSTLELAQGRLYFDSGDVAAAARAFAIETPYGRVTHAGTQFAVEASAADLVVMVRSGAAHVTTPALSSVVDRGEAVRISADGRELERWPVATSGALWTWADALAPALELEGRSLAEVLAEIARESGRLVDYESEDVRALCRTTRLHGPALALPADRLLDAVLASTELDARIEGDRLLIRRRAPL